jgi:hypothetical protein
VPSFAAGRISLPPRPLVETCCCFEWRSKCCVSGRLNGPLRALVQPKRRVQSRCTWRSRRPVGRGCCAQHPPGDGRRCRCRCVPGRPPACQACPWMVHQGHVRPQLRRWLSLPPLWTALSPTMLRWRRGARCLSARPDTRAGGRRIRLCHPSLTACCPAPAWKTPRVQVRAVHASPLLSVLALSRWQG